MPVYVPTTEMKADLLTKALATPTFRHLRDMIQFHDDAEFDSTRRCGVLEDTHLSETTRT